MNLEDTLLKQARALYKDRIRIAISAMLIVFSVTFYLFINHTISVYEGILPYEYPRGFTQGLEVVIAFNTIGFLISIILMALVFRIWSWAFLPGPASTYTLAVLQGILGPKANIRQIIGKRFKVTLENGMHFDVICKTKDRIAGEWFSYRLITDPLEGKSLREIALRHGFALKENRFVATVSSEELHQRTFLLAKAMMIANSAI
ncbi:MAG: hypothetical protein ACFFCT_08245 [Candidatus Odinarchaeota archaeon]